MQPISTSYVILAIKLRYYRHVTNIRIGANFIHLRKLRNFVFDTEVTGDDIF